MASNNYLSKIAIVGAGGNSGSYMTSSLLATGKHSVTAITREGSSSVLPEGVKVATIQYDNPSTIVEALKGQDALVITLGAMAPKGTQEKLVEAAEEAGLKLVVLNEWGPDSDDDGLSKGVPVFAPKGKLRREVAARGKIDFIGVCTGFWYEWSLAMPPSFGFDFAKKEVTLFDNGEQPVCVSTWPQVGRAVAAICSLPINADEDACLESIKNKLVYVNSFNISQRQMLESTLRVTGAKESDWTIKKESSRDRFNEGTEAMKKGERIGFVKNMYTRVFFPDGAGDYTGKGTLNEILGLKEEDVDEATKAAIKRSQEVASWA